VYANLFTRSSERDGDAGIRMIVSLEQDRQNKWRIFTAAIDYGCGSTVITASR